jgi:hypothetical protein
MNLSQYYRNIGYFEEIYTCENLTFHLQTEKDIKFGNVVKHGVESGVFFGVEFGVNFGVSFESILNSILPLLYIYQYKIDTKKGVMN